MLGFFVIYLRILVSNLIPYYNGQYFISMNTFTHS